VMLMGHSRLLQSSGARSPIWLLIGSHENMNRPSACYGIRSWIGGDSRLNIATQCAGGRPSPSRSTRRGRRRGRCLRRKRRPVAVWLDWATIQFRFFGHAATYTGSFCVFGPVLSSPAHAAPSLDMPPIEIEIFQIL
jgi:hypothetical protein